MKVALSLLFLMLALSYSEALKCLQCTSATLLEDKDCINGATKSTECLAAMQADGCMVTKSSLLGGWARTCCVGALCVDNDTNVGGAQVWNESCKTDGCNTMDPSKSGVSSVHTFGLPLAVATIWMAVKMM
eukprot:TRINITY_DN3025_c0_g1_i1.p1 TRINITY_DN3025_c0_g1~~TRINITY_DN3025_c0_g1_i1.p1  ORF type:complete len:131 (+),score=10.96 TRINITY_DN3025_c0_g1_i1:72-464(+)